MSIENNMINISKDRAFEKESFKSLFGLTLEVEKEIIFSIENNKKCLNEGFTQPKIITKY